MDVILHSESAAAADPRLLVGNEERDDAAVYDLGDGTAVISTTDFFMPIVDDARDFGRIASVNAISDVYAMGGTPMMAIAVLGWPVDKLPAEVANQVIEGARAVCAEAGILLAGGHSIDNPEPIFGLAVTGRVEIKHLKRNGGAKPGDLLYLTKPLGVGILTTAQKKCKLKPEHATLARDTMVIMNTVGAEFGKLPYVRAMTDVTGFGLLGHLKEMCDASDTSAHIRYTDVPKLPAEILDYYLAENCVPGGTKRNWAGYGDVVAPLPDAQRDVLADPQTSGGLLTAVDPAFVAEFEALAAQHGLVLKRFGEMVERERFVVTVS